jgi:FkbH-like protein
MKLSEALQILNEAELQGCIPFAVVLACGFTPLNLEIFFGAQLQKSLPERRVTVTTGLYGDLPGTLERPISKETRGVAVALEWPDLDARLGYRSRGSWGPAAEAEITESVKFTLQRLQAAIERLSISVPVAVTLPSLPLPPAFHPPAWEAGKTELEIHAAVAGFAANLALCRGVLIANPQRLLDLSRWAERLDFKGDLITGHPYSVSHSEAVGATLARLLAPPPSMKGLITDLDDTLWNGIIGELGSEAITWDLDSHAHIHGLYQQVLAALSQQGVLLAVASKNDLATVKQAFTRPDILVGEEKFFPLEVNWQPKSQSIGRILAAWNIAPDAVVFVDDSPMEIAEVKAAWPEMECLLFPKDDYAQALTLLRHVRDLFGKHQLTEDDGLRSASIRASAVIPPEDAPEKHREKFLSEARAVLKAQFDPPADSRILELVNKTNQFNLNCIRYSEAEWRQHLDSPNSFMLLVSYEDKYGPLGKIAVLAGRREDDALRVHTWAMSCRAFARRIEYACMEMLFSRFNVDELRFDFTPTPRNAPCKDAFAPFLEVAPEGPFAVMRGHFLDHCPRLYFQLETNG